MSQANGKPKDPSTSGKRIRIIGAVAAGTSAAAKARRNDPQAEIIVYERDIHISYVGCGLPYFISGAVENIEDLIPRDSSDFKKKYDVDIHIGHEVEKIDPTNRTLQIKRLEDGHVFTDHYDVLVIATGASSFVPPIPGREQPHVFSLRNPRDAMAIQKFIQEAQPKKAVVVGSGFIGLEMTESLVHLGIDVTLVEKLPWLNPALDEDMSSLLRKELEEKGVKILTGKTAMEIKEKTVALEEGEELEADIVLMSIGVRPNTQLALDAGIELGPTKGIKVDERMETSHKGIYACGDCIENVSFIDGTPFYRPMGTTANKTGRICGDVITGGDMRHPGVLGTGIFRVFDLTVAFTGMKGEEAESKGYKTAVITDKKMSKPGYYGGEPITIKAVADKETGKILGAQIIGKEGVDKRIDVLVTAITAGLKAEDLPTLDLAYSPPYSTATEPIHYVGMVLEKAANKT